MNDKGVTMNDKSIPHEVPIPKQKFNPDGVTIPHEVAYNITRRCLYTSYAFLIRDLKDFEKVYRREPTSEEVAHSTMLIDHFATVMKFYGNEE
jgi:hypothetical protein